MNKSVEVIKSINNDTGSTTSLWRWSNRVAGRKTAVFYEKLVQYMMSFNRDFEETWNVLIESNKEDENVSVKKISSTILAIIDDFLKEAEPDKVTFTFLGKHFVPTLDAVTKGLVASVKNYDVANGTSIRSVILVRRQLRSLKLRA